MIVLQLTSDYLPNPLWGMGWHVKFLIEAIRKKGVIVHIGAPNKSKNIDKNVITTTKEEDQHYLSPNAYEIFNDFKKFIEWQKLLAKKIIEKKIEPDIIHCHNWMSWIIAKEIKKVYPNVKIISTFHLIQKQYDTMVENPITKEHDKIIEIENQMLKESDKIILLTKRQLNLIKEGYEKIPLKKIEIIPLGMYFPEISFKEMLRKKVSQKNINITFVGRIEEDKGVSQILKAFSKISLSNDKIQLNIIGKGSKLNSLKKKYVQNKKIIFHGFLNRNELNKILEKSFIFCLPSYSESFGTSVMEAMSFGAVPIFSKGDSVPNLYRENFHGLKIPLKMVSGKYTIEEEDIIKKLNFLIDHQKILKILSKNTYEFSRKKYSMEKIVKKTLKTYEGIIK